MSGLFLDALVPGETPAAANGWIVPVVLIVVAVIVVALILHRRKK